ncbi:MAG TPA: hypothetical protein VFS21_08335 [Roseiflexaceae bacterium]|nr:hypothetical protein [Roseiflexaceae bacterium]
MDDDVISEIAAHQSVSPAAVRSLLDDLRAQVGGGPYYVFMFSGGGAGGGGGTSGRTRTLLAFATPDLALAFAQRNHLLTPGAPPRLRRLELGRLLLAMLREPAIAAVRLVRDEAQLVGGQLPEGATITRAATLDGLRGAPPETPSAPI